MGIIIPLVLIIISCLIIWKATNGFEIASDFLGRNLSEGVKGATINAIASSMPELLVSLFYLFYLVDIDGFSGGIGVTAGSAVFNGMMIPALAVLIVLLKNPSQKIVISRGVMLRDCLVLLIAESVFIIVISGYTLYWWHGLILVGIYLAYLAFMIWSVLRKKKEGNFVNAERGAAIYSPGNYDPYILKSALTLDLSSLILKKGVINSARGWILIIVSTIIMAAGSLLLVQATEWIGAVSYEIPGLGRFSGLGIHLIFVAFVLAAAASSVPDTIISVKDAKKGNYDDSISNALGSNIFNISFALGLPLFLYTLIYGPISMNIETIHLSTEVRIFLLISTFVAFIIYFAGKYFNRIKSIMLIVVYLIFMGYIIGKVYNYPLINKLSEFLTQIADMIR